MSDKGHCEHGEFELEKGCERCIEEHQLRLGDVYKPEEEAIPTLIKVQYYSESTGEISPRKYTYYSEDPLEVGDRVRVPVRDATIKAIVSAIDVPEAEIASFKDKVKTIVGGSVLGKMDGKDTVVAEAVFKPTPEQEEIEEGLRSEGLTLAPQVDGSDGINTPWVSTEGAPPPADTKINLCDTCIQRQPGCQHDPALTAYGDGVGNDNVIECDGYAPKETEERVEIDGEGNIVPISETTLVLRPGEDIEAHGYYQKSEKALKYAVARIITTAEDNKLANDDLAIIAGLKKAMVAKKKEYLDPLLNDAKLVRESYEYLMSPVLEAEKITKDKMLAYNAEQKRIRQVQEDINRKRIEAAQQEVRLKGEITEPLNLVEVMPAPAKTVSTDMGTSGQRDNWKYEIEDVDALPREYMIPSTVMLNAIAKSYHDQKKIPGIRFFNEPIIATRAR